MKGCCCIVSASFVKKKKKRIGREKTDSEEFGGTVALDRVDDGALFVEVAELGRHHLGVLERRKTL